MRIEGFARASDHVITGIAVCRRPSASTRFPKAGCGRVLSAGYPGQRAEVISPAIMRTERPIAPATFGEDIGR